MKYALTLLVPMPTSSPDLTIAMVEQYNTSPTSTGGA
jgi:hypothetical protein